MTLSLDDLQQIRVILKQELEPLQGSLEALKNDIKELYFMVAQ